MGRARNYFTYPGMAGDIMARCLYCIGCLQKQKTARLKDTSHQPDRSAGPLQKVYLDLYGTLPGVSRYNTLKVQPGRKVELATQDKIKYILTVEDDWSRFVDLIPLPSKDAGTVASGLMDEFVSIFWLPGELYSDRGKEFCNQVFTELSRLGKYYHGFSKAYNPQANRVERFHRSPGSLLTINLDRDDVNWISKLAAIKLAYNSKVHSFTGVTPALAFLGHKVKLPVKVMIPEPENPQSKYKWLSSLQETYSSIYFRMYAKGDSVNRTSQMQNYTATRKPRKPSDIVWYHVKRQVADKPPKLTQKWTGLYMVSQVSMKSAWS